MCLTLPAEVVRLSGRLVLLHQIVDDFARIVQLAEVVFEHVLALELVEEGTTFAQLVVLVQDSFEELWILLFLRSNSKILTTWLEFKKLSLINFKLFDQFYTLI